MNFKPTKKKIIIALFLSFLIILVLLTLLSLSGLNCHYGGNCEEGDVCIDYFSECSIFEFVYQGLGFMIIFWIILFLILYIINSLLQRKINN